MLLSWYFGITSEKLMPKHEDFDITTQNIDAKTQGF